MSNDIPSWESFTADEKQLTMRVFTGLTLPATHPRHRRRGRAVPRRGNHTEEAVLNIAFVESVHAKSYSSILCSTKEIDETFRWSDENSRRLEMTTSRSSYRQPPAIDSRKSRPSTLSRGSTAATAS
ncbi:hypothetical protein GCM10011610_01180 [Nocardia rhizosphaerihabitans]|uniref:Uncharacterized protein n=1 Tax=Nocardia rhizosphaerihabitans TaxID=1691570 RepID=A0ABQ2K2N9_9NOCA|nr:hypothetical protein GCM10011610_01180 [Nocardia rhizosphaerihabitans]